MNNNFDYLDQPQASGGAKKPSGDLIWNLLTVVTLLATLGIGAFFVSLFMDPYSSLNPLPPNTPFPTPLPPTSTPLGLDATWTPTITIEPTFTSTPRPTFTLEPTFTPFSLGSKTPLVSATVATPTKTPKPTGVPFMATILYYESTAYRPETNCSQMWIAGQTLDGSNGPLLGLQIKLGGSVPGKVFLPPITTLSGIAPIYGQSGFEFNPGVQPVASSKTLWVQLLDQSGASLSEQVFLTTFNDCKKNLIFVRFQQK